MYEVFLKTNGILIRWKGLSYRTPIKLFINDNEIIQFKSLLKTTPSIEDYEINLMEKPVLEDTFKNNKNPWNKNMKSDKKNDLDLKFKIGG